MTRIETATTDDLKSCLSILKRASKSDPFVEWLGEANPIAPERYFQYSLRVGVHHGTVYKAEPRAGVSITTPLETATSWSLQTLQIVWRWLRLRVLFSVEQWAVMREISKGVVRQEGSQGLFIWYLGVVPDYRDGNVARRMLAKALGGGTSGQVPPHAEQPIFLHTAQPQLTQLLRTAGAEELEQIVLSKERPPLTLFKSERKRLATTMASRT